MYEVPKPSERRLLRNSERSSYKRCRFRWKLGWVDCWVPIREKPALRFGTLIHAALAEFYRPGKKRGPLPAITFARLYDKEVEQLSEFGIYADDEWTEARVLGIEMLEHYHEHYGRDNAIEVIGPEVPFQIDMPTRNGKKYLVTPVGTFDAVIRMTHSGRVGLLEHKTAASLPSEPRHLQLDEQAGTYWALAGAWLRGQGIIGPDEDIEFILYNFLRKAMRDTRPVNSAGLRLNKPTKKALVERATALGIPKPSSHTVDTLMSAIERRGEDPAQLGEPSKTQPAPHFVRLPVFRDEPDRENLLWRLRAEAWEMGEARAGRLPIYKNPTRDCHWDCSFYDACELHESGGDWKELLRLAYTRWNPLEGHIHDNDIPAGI